jgi:hypothetical protein
LRWPTHDNGDSFIERDAGLKGDIGPVSRDGNRSEPDLALNTHSETAVIDATSS